MLDVRRLVILRAVAADGSIATGRAQVVACAGQRLSEAFQARGDPAMADSLAKLT
jgi:hypothetical protein